MSVTFTAIANTTDFVVLAATVACECGSTRRASFSTYDEAADYGRKIRSGAITGVPCADQFCDPTGVRVDLVTAGEVGPELNVSNSNARFLLGLLGLPTDEDLSGSIDGSDMLGRALVACAVSPADEGVPAHDVLPGDGDAAFGAIADALGVNVVEGEPQDAPAQVATGLRMVDCGRRAGYAQERLAELVQVAQFAADRGWVVSYG